MNRAGCCFADYYAMIRNTSLCENRVKDSIVEIASGIELIGLLFAQQIYDFEIVKVAK